MILIITNYGCSGTGKSSFSAAMASAITEANSRATILLINFSANVPMHAIWEPTRELSRSYSIGTMFENDKIDEKALTKCIVTLEHNKNIGTLSYCLGDSPLSYADLEYKKIIDMFKAAEQLVDYVIVDCGTELLSDTVAASIEMANCLNVFLTPDPNGVVYYKTSNLLYGSNPKFMVGTTNYIFAPCRSFHATKEICNSLQIKAFELPYSTDIAVKNCEGNIFEIYKSAPRKYKNVVKKVLASANVLSKRGKIIQPDLDTNKEQSKE